MDEDWFRVDNERVIYYTGISTYENLLHVCRLVSAKVNKEPRQKLSNFQCFILTCMKLRLDLGFEDIDQVLADRGFTCANSFSLYSRVELVIPAFTRGKPQLSAAEVQFSRDIANVRIHIERVIGGVKNKYSILQHILPIKIVMDSEQDLSKIDKLVTTCCALFNICPSIMPFD